MNASSKAIVISTESFGEADMYIQFFTQKWGMISTLAKSARKSKKRYIGGLDLFCHNEIFVRGDVKDRPYLVELSVLNSFQGIRDSLDKMLASGKILHWVKKLADQSVAMPSLYSLLGQTLSLIEKETDLARLDLLVLIFRLKLISLLGLKPKVDACVRCDSNETEEVIFDIESGGILCKACLSGNYLRELSPLHPFQRKFLTTSDSFLLTKFEEIEFPENHTQSLSRLVTLFASYHTHLKLPH